jgi:hypothetical protein
MHIRVFCDIAASSLVGIDRCFRGAYCHHHQRDHPSLSLMTSEASGYSDNDVTEGLSSVLLQVSPRGGGGGTSVTYGNQE